MMSISWDQPSIAKRKGEKSDVLDSQVAHNQTVNERHIQSQQAFKLKTISLFTHYLESTRSIPQLTQRPTKASTLPPFRPA